MTQVCVETLLERQWAVKGLRLSHHFDATNPFQLVTMERPLPVPESTGRAPRNLFPSFVTPKMEEPWDRPPGKSGCGCPKTGLPEEKAMVQLSKRFRAAE
jgi:hypothetical protein